MKSLIIFISLLLFSSGILGQVITGKITDKCCAEPLIGAVAFISEKLNSSTNINGEYTINVPEGTYDISFSFLGYETYVEKGVTVLAGANLRLDISLEESVSALNVAVVSAGKFEQKLEELTVSMEV